ncbi:MAG TPA: hypothetical protein VIS99_02980 [Terrimicrobiaceae bacterium]
MYVYSRGELGEPEKKGEVTRSGDKVGPWLAENLPTDLARVIGLKVTFRRSFPDFRHEVEVAAERWIEPARHARALIAAREGHLKKLHKQMLDENVPDKAAVQLAGSFFYKVPTGAWRIANLLFPPERGRWTRI